MAPQTINDHIVYWTQANETRLAMIRRLLIGRANYACSSRDIRAILALFNLDLFEKFLSDSKYSGPNLFGPLRRVCTYHICQVSSKITQRDFAILSRLFR